MTADSFENTFSSTWAGKKNDSITLSDSVLVKIRQKQYTDVVSLGQFLIYFL